MYLLVRPPLSCPPVVAFVTGNKKAYLTRKYKPITGKIRSSMSGRVCILEVGEQLIDS